MAPKLLVAACNNGAFIVKVFFVVLLITVLTVIFTANHSHFNSEKARKWQPSPKFYTFTEKEISFETSSIQSRIAPQVPLITNKRLVIGAVSCRNITDTEPETGQTPEEQMKYSEETVIMLKSVLISARIYGIATVELHLFLENVEQDTTYFKKQLDEFEFPNGEVKLELHVHDAVAAVPEQYRDHMVYHPRYRCGYVRFFFPTALPNVDSIIHLDSDMIITGNIWRIWENLYNFQGEQLIGVARSNEAHDTHYLKMTKNWFGDIPHPGPRGVNAGLLVMNLTKMREYDWDRKFVKTYEDYSKIVKLTGQRTINILLGYDTGILRMMSCKYNFCHRHCDKGFTCLDAKEDQVHLVHGNGFKMECGQVFHSILKGFKEFNMTLITTELEDKQMIRTLKEHLMSPIRQEYVKEHCNNKCYGLLNSLLFQDHYTRDD